MENQGQKIINFGVTAEYGQTSSIKVKGKHLFKNVPSKDKKEFFYSLLSIGQQIWNCVSCMQEEAGKPPIATDNNRDCKFSAVLQNYMINQAEAGVYFNQPWK